MFNELCKIQLATKSQLISIPAALRSLRKGIKYVAVFVAAVLTNGYVSSANATSPKTIAIIQIIEHPALNATRDGIIDTLKKTNPDAKILWESAQGSPALANQICQGFVGQSADLIVALGTTAAQAALSVTTQSEKSRSNAIPVIFASVTDPQSANIADKSCGVSNYIDVEKQIAMIRQILPDLKTLGMIYNPGEPFTEKILQLTQEVCNKEGLTLITSAVPKTSDVGTATASIVGQVEAIFINNDNTALAAFPVIVKICDGKKIPVFASDVDLIDQGALAVLGPNQYKIGVQTAKLVEISLDNPSFIGESIKNRDNVTYPEYIETNINEMQAKKLNVTVNKKDIK